MIKEAIIKTKNFLAARQQAYQQTFSNENVHAQKVLSDLANFCRAHESTFHPDPRAHAVLEGRREVFLRISYHLKLDPDQLWATYGRKDLE